MHKFDSLLVGSNFQPSMAKQFGAEKIKRGLDHVELDELRQMAVLLYQTVSELQNLFTFYGRVAFEGLNVQQTLDGLLTAKQLQPHQEIGLLTFRNEVLRLRKPDLITVIHEGLDNYIQLQALTENAPKLLA